MDVHSPPPAIPTEADSAAYDTFDWRMDPLRFNDLPQTEGTAVRAARGFCVEDEIWFDPYPMADHVRWWDTVIKDEYDREWKSADPNYILYFKVPNADTFLVPFPKAINADAEAVLRMARLLKELEVPPDVTVHWTMNELGSYNAPAADYYKLID